MISYIYFHYILYIFLDYILYIFFILYIGLWEIDFSIKGQYFPPLISMGILSLYIFFYHS